MSSRDQLEITIIMTLFIMVYLIVINYLKYRDTFHPYIFMSIILIYVYPLESLYQFITGNQVFSDHSLSAVLYLTILSAIMLYLGMKFVYVCGSPKGLKPARNFNDLGKWAIVVLILSWATWLSFVIISGGFRSVYSQAHGTGFKWNEVTGYYYALMDWGFVGPVILLHAYLCEKTPKWFLRKWVVVCSYVVSAAIFLSTGERGETFYILAGAFTLYHLAMKTRPRVLKALPIVFLIVIAIALLAPLRGSMVLDSPGLPQSSWEQLMETALFQQGEFNPLRVNSALDSATLYYELYPERAEFHYGRDILALPLMIIPRAWWGKKHEFLQSFKGKEPDYSFIRQASGSPPTIIGDGWIQGGVIGVALTMFMMGLIWGWSYKKALASASTSPFQVVYTLLLIISTRWMLFGISLDKTLWNIAPIVICYGLSGLQTFTIIKKERYDRKPYKIL